MSIRGSLRGGLLLVLACVPAPATRAAIHHPGKWTNPILWKQGSGSDFFKETAVNMALLALPDSAGHTQARILWFQDDHEHLPGQHTVYGGYWDWRAPGDSLLNAGTFPDTTGVTGTLRARRFPSPGYNIFCSGMAHLEEDQGYGRLLVAGGTTEAENGSTEARIYDARTNSWEPTANELGVGRWYPTLTTLPTGRTLVTSGSRFREMWLVGGAATDSLVHRDPIAHGEAWRTSLLPAEFTGLGPPYRMGPRRGHSASSSLGGTQVYFGGIDLNTSEPVDHFWQLRLERNPDGADHVLKWERRTASPAGDVGPSARVSHAAAIVPASHSPLEAASLLVVGGDTTATGEADAAVWIGRLVDLTNLVFWQQLTPTFDSDAFPARYGHTAYWHPGFTCLFVYGGLPGGGAGPDDPSVYSFEMVDGGDDDSVRIKRCALQDGEQPPPRAHFASGLLERRIPDDPQNPAGELNALGLCVYGGRTGTGASDVSDSLYVLWPLDSVTVRWQRVPQSANSGSSLPPALEFASGTGTTNTVEFWVTGGRDAGGTARAEVRSFHVHCQPCGPDSTAQWGRLVAEWEERPSTSQPVWGHAMPLATHETFARTPETYDPASNAFTHHPSVHRLQDWYPHTFVLPGSGEGTTITTGPDTQTWKFEAATATWTQVASATAGLRGGSAVMYRPGRIMKCGSRDTDGVGGAAIGTTLTLDATAGSPNWQASDTMIGRVNHNLTLLPDGKVLVTGGLGVRDNQENEQPRRRPELWDPDASGGTGAWEGGDGIGTQLDESQVARGYHSTALLLPDGRVLCAGGNATNHAGDTPPNDQFRVDIYSPPYLFNADGTGAVRPGLKTAPRRVSHGQEFVVSVGGSDVITGGCLIRAGAATHGYDSSQLYLPLAFTQVGPSDPDTRYYKTTAPADSAAAPPGDYLLFVRNSLGVPAIARWVRVSRSNDGTGVPTTVTDLGRECLDGPSVRLRWTPPGSDVGEVVLMPVTRYEVKLDTLPISNLTDFLTHARHLTPPEPGEPLGSPDRKDTLNLTVGTTYYFRLRAKNATSFSGNWSELSNEFSWTVHDEECGGSGGGGGGGGSEYEVDLRQAGGRFSGFGRPGDGGSIPDSGYAENTLLPNAPLNVTRRDLVRLPFGPRWTETGARVRLSRAGTRATHFERVRLLAVEHAAGEGAFVRGGQLVGGLTHDPVRVVHADGRDLTGVLLAGGVFEGRDGDTLYAELGADGPGSLALTSSGAHLVRSPDRTGIDLACESGSGWTPIGRHEVRERTSEEVFDAPSLRWVRLAFRGLHRLEAVQRFTAGAAVGVTAHEPLGAEHSRLGAVGGSFAAGTGEALAPGEQLLVDFGAAPGPEAAAQAWFLEVTGAHLEAAGGAAGATLARTDASGVPAAFALARNRPNPFTGRTTLAFDVPRRAHVRLEIFDVLGRRVATLADGEYAPGRFTLEWDGRTAAGTPARAGVYLCRMRADGFRARQHLVLVK